MSAFLDASVIVAILSHESDEDAQIARVASAKDKLYFSSVVVYEAAFALARKKTSGGRATEHIVEEARSAVVDFLRSLSAEEVAIAGDVTDLAVAAGARFGKIVGHPAKLNMGDCFAYACARRLDAALLYKGDDYSKTDIRLPDGDPRP